MSADATEFEEVARRVGVSPHVDPRELDNKTLLELVAALDGDRFPIVEHAERALTQLEASES